MQFDALLIASCVVVHISLSDSKCISRIQSRRHGNRRRGENNIDEAQIFNFPGNAAFVGKIGRESLGEIESEWMREEQKKKKLDCPTNLPGSCVRLTIVREESWEDNFILARP